MINWIFVTFLHVDPRNPTQTLRELNKKTTVLLLGKQPQNISKCFLCMPSQEWKLESDQGLMR